MIVNCPKCGFSQPKDRYCANCGIDMEAYQPQEPSLSSKILRSWIFQAGVLCIAILTALSFLKLQEQQKEQEGVAALNQPPAVPRSGQATLEAPPSPTPTPLPTATPTVTTQIQQAADHLMGIQATPPPPPPPPARNNTRTNGTLAAGTRAGETSRDTLFTQLDIIYTELPRAVFANLTAESRVLETDGVMVAGIYPDIAPLMSRLTQAGSQTTRSFRVLDSARSLPIKTNQPIVTFKGMRDPTIDRNIGISSQIIPLGMDENGLHFQVEIQRTLREPGSPTGLLEWGYQLEFTLPKGAGAFISGILPKRALDERERALYTNAGVLKVLASPDFQSNFSEFVLFIEAR